MNPRPPPPKPLTTGDAAAILGVSRSQVIRWADAGKLPGYRLPGSAYRRFTPRAVAVFAEEHGIPAPSDN